MRNAAFCLLRTLLLLGSLVFCLQASQISAQNQDVEVINVTATKSMSILPPHPRKDGRESSTQEYRY
jgi:hypothetical protein